MRGRREPKMSMLGFVDLEARVAADHPLRTIKKLADRALVALSPEFDRMYAEVGCPPSRRSGCWSEPADRALHRAQRARLLRGAGLQPPLPLVPGHAAHGAELCDTLEDGH